MDSVSQANLNRLWNQTLAAIGQRIERDDFEAWIQPLKPLSLESQTLAVAVPSRSFGAWIEQNLLEPLLQAWADSAGFRPQLRWVYGDAEAQGELFAPAARAERLAPAHRKSPGRDQLIDRYSFANFVVGPSNQFARAAAQAVAQQPGTLYNPFFLYGGVGLGKTHLANAVGHAILEARCDAKVLFISSDGFTNQLIEAIGRNKAQDFKNRMRRLDVLIVDDVQFLAGRERTQEEFFHIFNTLYDSGRQIILTSDAFPNELDGIQERLCNRFGWGLVADIQIPDVETRVAILQRKARDERIELPLTVASFLANRIDSNIRDLEGALTRISAYASLNRSDITLALAEELLLGGTASAARTVTLEAVERGVASHFGLREGELRARKRTKKVAEARQLAMYIMRSRVGASFPSIGQYLGGRDHSTVVHACQTVERRCKKDLRFRSMVDSVARMIGCG